MHTKYENRSEAGDFLAIHLEQEIPKLNLVVLALPRGGVEVALPIAIRMRAPLEVLVVRKLGAPKQNELALGAIASGGFIYLNQDLADDLKVTPKQIAKIRDRETRELERRESLYYQGRERMTLADKRVLIVDDGIATGATMEVAIRAVKASQPKALYVAVPVASLSAIERLHRFCDYIYSLQTPSIMGAIGEYYENFMQVSDERVIQVLAEAKRASERNSLD